MNLLDIGLLLLAAWIIWYALRAAEAFKSFKRGRALHTAHGAVLVRNETIRHGRAVAAANDWRQAISQEREDEARQAVLRG